jgi:LysM repeat protein
MKKIRPVFLALLALSVILILATGCFRPAAPDVTPTSSEGAEAATPEEPDIEATAIANATLAAETAAAQTAEPEPGEEPAETSTAPAPTATAEPATPMPTTRPPTPEPTAEATETPVPVGEVTHVVQAGENLFRIALRYDTTVEAIAQANGIANASQIYVGQELTIPAGSAPSEPSQPSPGGMTYVVQPGDNLFRIALRYNISHLRLAEYNGIANPSNIYVGQVIRIPPQ